MEVESFENEEVARLLNDWFVSIKVSCLFFSHFWLYLLTFSRIFHYDKKNVGIYLFSCVIFFNIPRSWHGWNIFFSKWCCVACLFYHFIYIDHKFLWTFCSQSLSFSRSFVSKSYLQQVDREERPDVDKVRKMHAMKILIYSSITP